MFTPIETSLGALLLHQATSILLFQNGEVLGVSGLMHRVVTAPSVGVLSFFAGMAASLLPIKLWLPELTTVYPSVPSTLHAVVATVGIGALVGWGTKISQGCTSGHMLCGLARLSGRSLLAVATFFPIAMITHHLAHPAYIASSCAEGVPCYTPTYPSSSSTTTLVALTAVSIVAAQVLPRIISKFSKKEGKDVDYTARQTTHLFSGFEFGLGLQLSQMSSPDKVLAFLSFPNMSAWDPSMALVILFGLLPSLFEIRLRGLTTPPRFSGGFVFSDISLRDTDWLFVAGAAVFGIGWGLTGTCPGPAVLRAFIQPLWGVLWMSGFWAGGLIVSSEPTTCG